MQVNFANRGHSTAQSPRDKQNVQPTQTQACLFDLLWYGDEDSLAFKNNTNLSIQNEMLRRRGTVRPYGEETKWTARERRWSYRRISSIVVRVAHQPQYLYHPLGDGGKFCVQSKHRHQRFIRVSKQANSDTDLSKLLQCYIGSMLC